MDGDAQAAARRWIRPVRWLLGIAFFVVFKATDPFGIDTALKQHAYQVTSRLVGLCYGGCLQRGGAGPVGVTVVLLDDAFVAAAPRKGQWPVRWADHAELIRAIAGYDPRAIFLDFAYQRPRDYSESGSPDSVPPADSAVEHPEIRALRMAIEDAVVPVVLGEIMPEAGSAQSPPDLAKPCTLVRPPGATPPAIACAAKMLAPIRWPSEVHPSVYPLAVQAPGGGEHQPGFVTPALALLQVAPLPPADPPGLRQRPHAGARAHAQRPLTPGHADKMLVAWNLRGSSLDLLRNKGDCAKHSSFWSVIYAALPGLERVVIAFNVWHDQKQHGQAITRAEPCLPVDVVSAFDVEASTPPSTVDGRGPSIDELLRGRFVLVGSGRGPGDPDRVETPLGGHVPGVLLHAMALDNLLRFAAAGAWTIQHEEIFGAVPVAEIAAVGALLVALLMQVFFVPRMEESRWHRFGWALPPLAFLVALCIANLLLAFGWAEVLAAAVVVLGFETVIRLAFGLDHWLEHGLVAKPRPGRRLAPMRPAESDITLEKAP